MRFAALVLAAGEGSRFGGHKLLAQLDGLPILQHVLDAVAAAGPSVTIVVLGADAPELERRIQWRDEARVVNPAPARGLSSSLSLGVSTVLAAAGAESLDSILVVLGDQPRTRTAVIHALIEAETDRPMVVPRFGDGARNPVLLLPDAWPLAARATGDRGLGAFIDAHPDLVLELPMSGTNPDVDTPADLRELEAEPPDATPAGA
ncbi:MAG: molybdenum cofactor cytidylyltransferase [Chloroflexota bacterium]|nr:molybdenum cofactor cytidylyltransferase [Chloroflexota bacterium]